MRAALMIETGKPLEGVDDVEIRGPRAGEVLVGVKNCGICHSDLTVLDSPGSAAPAILGHEAAGIVEEIGTGVTNLAVGDADDVFDEFVARLAFTRRVSVPARHESWPYASRRASAS